MLFESTELKSGVLLILAAVLTWTMYALAQKQLLKTLPSATITLLIYLAATLIFLPLARPAQLFHLNRATGLLLAFCALSTLISWSSFAEALNHVEASRVSMVLALIPLITVTAMTFGGRLLPNVIQPEQLNFLSIVGTVLVVIGSMVVALQQST
jgi:drug/metabolite transporter (DMT)-like permease